jgi:hypothetical protein
MIDQQAPTTDQRIIEAIHAHLAQVFAHLGAPQALIQVNISEIPESNGEETGPYLDMQATARVPLADMAMENPTFGRKGLAPAAGLPPLAAEAPAATAGRIDSDAERKKRTRFYGDN